MSNSKGKKTDKAKGTLVFCASCGGFNFRFEGWSKGNQAIMRCTKCGTKANSKNLMPNVNFEGDQLEFELMSKGAQIPPRQAPDPKKPPKKDDEFVTFTCRMTAGEHRFVKEGLEEMRLHYGLTGKSWIGTALVDAVADWRAGNVGNIGGDIKSPDVKQLTPKSIRAMKGARLRALAVFVTSRGIDSLFRDEKEMQDYVVANMPRAFVTAPGEAAIDKNQLKMFEDDIEQMEKRTAKDLSVTKKPVAKKAVKGAGKKAKAVKSASKK